MSSKRYPEEFKIEAVKQVVDRGHSVSSVATRLCENPCWERWRTNTENGKPHRQEPEN